MAHGLGLLWSSRVKAGWFGVSWTCRLLKNVGVPGEQEAISFCRQTSVDLQVSALARLAEGLPMIWTRVCDYEG